MKVTLTLAIFSVALALPASADEVQSTPGKSTVPSQLGQQQGHYEKALELMEEEKQKPSWGWDEYECGSFPEDKISLVSRYYGGA